MKALVCGSFDPVTNGHIDLIKRAAGMFESVTVGIFVNKEKQYTFPMETRRVMLENAVKDIKNVTVDVSYGYVADYVKERGIGVIVKGVRNTADYEYELNMAKYNKAHAPNTETVFLPASDETESLSSTLVKQLFASGEDISRYVPASVAYEFDKIKEGK